MVYHFVQGVINAQIVGGSENWVTLTWFGRRETFRQETCHNGSAGVCRLRGFKLSKTRVDGFGFVSDLHVKGDPCQSGRLLA